MSTNPVQPSAKLFQGDPAPWFEARCTGHPLFRLDAAAGRYVVLCFLGSAGSEAAIQAVRIAITQHRSLFDDQKVQLFFVSTDPDDERLGRLRQSLPGVRHIWDFDRKVSRLYGVSGGSPESVSRCWFVLDPMLRILTIAPLRATPAVMALVADLPHLSAHAGVELTAPVLILPRILEPAFCKHLIGLYQSGGGTETGVMVEMDGQTVMVHDPLFKRRRDHQIQDEDTRTAIRGLLWRRLVPEMRKAFQFDATHIERYIIACYDAAEGGHFVPHRDNTTPGTAHRRFAVTVNLNQDYEGGDLRFPEFGGRLYRAPVGGAVVFSCSLLHEVTPVIKGKRFALLPFLYDGPA